MIDNSVLKRLAIQCGLSDYRGLIENQTELQVFAQAAQADQATTIAQLQADNAKLREKAKAVIDRWNSPLWKDLPNTGKFIHELNEALSTSQPESQPESQTESTIRLFRTAQKPLSDEEIDKLTMTSLVGSFNCRIFARAIEKAHGIGE